MDIKKALERLESFKALKENWDGYGGIPPSLASIEVAERLLKGLFICLGPDGTVEITFGDEEVEITIDREGDACVRMEYRRRE